MSDTPLPNVGSSDAEIVDKTIQRESDRFAAPELSVDPELHGSQLAFTSRSSTNATIATRAFDSRPAYDSTTALGDALARTESTDLADEDTGAPDDRGAF